MSKEFGRRQFVSALGIAAATTALAGCSTSTRSEGSGTTERAGTTTEQAETTTTKPATTTTAASGSVPSKVSSYLSGVSNFDGSLADRTGSSEVTVKVGAEGNGGNFAFAPPAIKISTGTTVVWEWTGKGGGHNVVAEDGTFDSGGTVSEKGHTFEHTFENSGVYTYYCEPHKPLGMKGAVVVE